MRLRALHSRDDLLALARQHCPTRACETAMDEGRTLILGGFTPPGDFPRWVVRVTSKRKSVWYIAILADAEANAYRVQWPENVDDLWQHWSGSPNGCNPLYDGDMPLTFSLTRATARRKAARGT